MTDSEIIADKCAVCSTYIIVGTMTDLRQEMHAHELAAHGRVRPADRDHADTDYR